MSHFFNVGKLIVLCKSMSAHIKIDKLSTYSIKCTILGVLCFWVGIFCDILLSLYVVGAELNKLNSSLLILV